MNVCKTPSYDIQVWPFEKKMLYIDKKGGLAVQEPICDNYMKLFEWRVKGFGHIRR